MTHADFNPVLWHVEECDLAHDLRVSRARTYEASRAFLHYLNREMWDMFPWGLYPTSPLRFRKNERRA